MNATALLSVSDKTQLIPFAHALSGMGYTILSTGGTARHLRAAGIDVVAVSDHTGADEILDGRVKTLHPTIHGGILARRSVDEDMRTLTTREIAPIDLVVVNLYPFESVVAREETTFDEAMEHIDIGGPTMVRAAAKNHKDVTVVVDPDDYDDIIEALSSNTLGANTRRQLALKAFAHTAAYDAAISSYFASSVTPAPKLDEEDVSEVIALPAQHQRVLLETDALRYGENPHQLAVLYHDVSQRPWGGFEQLHGKAMSFNNIVDADAAIALVAEFDAPTVSIIKHTNPAGCASGQTLEVAYEHALACDAKSAFGGIVACNRIVTAALASRMHDHFFEVIAAPGFEDEALAILQQKKNIRLLVMPDALVPPSLAMRETYFGVLAQTGDARIAGWNASWTCPTGTLDDALRDALLFQWRVCKHVKSNAIVIGRDAHTVGVGAGQMSRVDAVELAVEKALSSTQGCVMASDAFFPFRDAVDVAAKAGVRAIIQPGGSRRDPEVIDACKAHQITMVLTGRRHFRHG